MAQEENELMNNERHIPKMGGGQGTILPHWQIVAVLAVLGALLCSCSGGGGSSVSSPPPPPVAKTVVWEAPQSFVDNTPLVPATNLDRFEIYVRQDPSFGPDDSPIATASPTDTTFNLGTLSPPLSRGVTYYVSIRAVTTEGETSDFSTVRSFSISQ